MTREEIEQKYLQAGAATWRKLQATVGAAQDRASREFSRERDWRDRMLAKLGAEG